MKVITPNPSWVERRCARGVVMPGSSDRRRSDTASRQISASPDVLYRAFVEPTTLMQWLPPAGMTGRTLEYDFRVGGRYRIELRHEDAASDGSGKTTDRTDVTKGRFIDLVPGRRITQSVEFESGDPAFAGEMTMTWSFEPTPDGAMVRVTADNVPSGISKEDHDAGLSSSLDNLARFV
jgi:uncharacterized protein YndB with AHSA1/START domain